MADNDFRVEKNNIPSVNQQENQAPKQQQGKVIDEANYRVHAPRESGPTAVGRGGDPLF